MRDKMKIANFGLIRDVVALLPKGARSRILKFSFFQILATSFDLLALLLLGVISKQGLDFVNGKRTYIEIPRFQHSGFEGFSFEQQFSLLSGLVIILFIFKTAFSIWLNKKTLMYLGKQSAFATKEVLRRLFESKPQYVIGKNTQELLYGVTVGVDSLVLTYLGSFTLFVTEILFVTILLMGLLIIQPVAGICALIIFGGSGLLIHRFTSAKAKTKSQESGNISVLYSQRLLEVLGLYRELFLKGTILKNVEEIQDLRNRYLEIRSDLMFLPTYSKYLFEFVLVLGGTIVAMLQLALSDSGQAISALVLFLAASSRILPSIIRLQGAFLSMKQSEGLGQITLRQIQEFYSHQDLVGPEHEADKISIKESDYVSVKNLSFKYENNDNFVLKGLNFSVRRGQLVAIVGESGAGKSTLADLILGIQEPTIGTIAINGFQPRSLIKRQPGALAYVPQDIAIVDGTIRRNIVLTEMNEMEGVNVSNALSKAFLWEEVKRMPGGELSIVGERGMKLSGGQRQRLGIARAIYSNPELIVFDEATSSLDPITEKAVTDAIYQNQNEVTLIVIAHRLSTVRKADVVILLEDGQLVASGTFEEVREKSPKFDQQAKLVNL